MTKVLPNFVECEKSLLPPIKTTNLWLSSDLAKLTEPYWINIYGAEFSFKNLEQIRLKKSACSDCGINVVSCTTNMNDYCKW